MSTRNENAPLQRGELCATTTKHEPNHSGNHEPDKVFLTLQARFAMLGHTLRRTTDASGAVLYVASRWGFTREIKTLEQVAAFLAQIGGRV